MSSVGPFRQIHIFVDIMMLLFNNTIMQVSRWLFAVQSHCMHCALWSNPPQTFTVCAHYGGWQHEKWINSLTSEWALTMFPCIWVRGTDASNPLAPGMCSYSKNVISVHMLWINSLTPGSFEWHFGKVIFKLISVTDGWGISCKIAVSWMSLRLTDD